MGDAGAADARGQNDFIRPGLTQLFFRRWIFAPGDDGTERKPE